jgi:hypothetical protein
MRIEALSGNGAGIRHAYNELTSLLGEIDGSADGAIPSPATTALLEQLLMEDPRTARRDQPAGQRAAFGAVAGV